MSKIKFPEIKSYGLTTIGERGQIVIPKKIREEMKIKKGNKFLVFTKADKVISFIKSENFDKIIDELTAHLSDLKNVKK